MLCLFLYSNTNCSAIPIPRRSRHTHCPGTENGACQPRKAFPEPYGYRTHHGPDRNLAEIISTAGSGLIECKTEKEGSRTAVRWVGSVKREIVSIPFSAILPSGPIRAIVDAKKRQHRISVR